MNPPTAPAQPVDLATESVAGEEDPGASMELDAAMPTAPQLPVDFCRACAGTGVLNGGPCPDCEGSGRVGLEAAP